MKTARFLLAWTVPAAGFRWIKAKAVRTGEANARPLLALVENRGPDVEDIRQAPPEEPHPVLFRLFSETPADEDGSQAFAARYGNLTGGWELLPVARGKAASSGPVSGVFLETWQGQIAAMRRLTNLWELIQQEDREGLARHVFWGEASPGVQAVFFDSHPDLPEGTSPPAGDFRVREPIASAASDAALFGRFQPGDVLEPAKAYLQVELDLHLHHAADDVRVGMSWDARRSQPVIAYSCPTLLSAVWLQFATVVNENLAFGRCPECGQWFEVAPNAARSSRRFCSTGCRSKAYRERQDRARQLFTAGKTFEEIAAELESDAATVKKWVTGFRE
jgi:hypothetical protein